MRKIQLDHLIENYLIERGFEVIPGVRFSDGWWQIVVSNPHIHRIVHINLENPRICGDINMYSSIVRVQSYDITKYFNLKEPGSLEKLEKCVNNIIEYHGNWSI